MNEGVRYTFTYKHFSQYSRPVYSNLLIFCFSQVIKYFLYLVSATLNIVEGIYGKIFRMPTVGK